MPLTPAEEALLQRYRSQMAHTADADVEAHIHAIATGGAGSTVQRCWAHRQAEAGRALANRVLLVPVIVSHMKERRRVRGPIAEAEHRRTHAMALRTTAAASSSVQLSNASHGSPSDLTSSANANMNANSDGVCSFGENGQKKGRYGVKEGYGVKEALSVAFPLNVRRGAEANSTSLDGKAMPPSSGGDGQIKYPSSNSCVSSRSPNGTCRLSPLRSSGAATGRSDGPSPLGSPLGNTRRPDISTGDEDLPLPNDSLATAPTSVFTANATSTFSDVYGTAMGQRVTTNETSMGGTPTTVVAYSYLRRAEAALRCDYAALVAPGPLPPPVVFGRRGEPSTSGQSPKPSQEGGGGGGGDAEQHDEKDTPASKGSAQKAGTEERGEGDQQAHSTSKKKKNAALYAAPLATTHAPMSVAMPSPVVFQHAQLVRQTEGLLREEERRRRLREVAQHVEQAGRNPAKGGRESDVGASAASISALFPPQDGTSPPPIAGHRPEGGETTRLNAQRTAATTPAKGSKVPAAKQKTTQQAPPTAAFPQKQQQQPKKQRSTPQRQRLLVAAEVYDALAAMPLPTRFDALLDVTATALESNLYLGYAAKEDDDAAKALLARLGAVEQFFKRDFLAFVQRPRDGPSAAPSSSSVPSSPLTPPNHTAANVAPSAPSSPLAPFVVTAASVASLFVGFRVALCEAHLWREKRRRAEGAAADGAPSLNRLSLRRRSSAVRLHTAQAGGSGGGRGSITDGHFRGGGCDDDEALIPLHGGDGGAGTSDGRHSSDAPSSFTTARTLSPAAAGLNMSALTAESAGVDDGGEEEAAPARVDPMTVCAAFTPSDWLLSRDEYLWLCKAAGAEPSPYLWVKPQTHKQPLSFVAMASSVLSQRAAQTFATIAADLMTGDVRAGTLPLQPTGSVLAPVVVAAPPVIDSPEEQAALLTSHLQQQQQMVLSLGGSIGRLSPALLNANANASLNASVLGGSTLGASTPFRPHSPQPQSQPTPSAGTLSAPPSAAALFGASGLGRSAALRGNGAHSFHFSDAKERSMHGVGKRGGLSPNAGPLLTGTASRSLLAGVSTPAGSSLHVSPPRHRGTVHHLPPMAKSHNSHHGPRGSSPHHSAGGGALPSPPNPSLQVVPAAGKGHASATGGDVPAFLADAAALGAGGLAAIAQGSLAPSGPLLPPPSDVLALFWQFSDDKASFTFKYGPLSLAATSDYCAALLAASPHSHYSAQYGQGADVGNGSFGARRGSALAFSPHRKGIVSPARRSASNAARGAAEGLPDEGQPFVPMRANKGGTASQSAANANGNPNRSTSFSGGPRPSPLSTRRSLVGDCNGPQSPLPPHRASSAASSFGTASAVAALRERERGPMGGGAGSILLANAPDFSDEASGPQRIEALFAAHRRVLHPCALPRALEAYFTVLFPRLASFRPQSDKLPGLVATYDADKDGVLSAAEFAAMVLRERFFRYKMK